MEIKKFVANITIILIICSAFLTGYMNSSSLTVFGDDETESGLFPYQDQMQDSTAAIYVYMRSFGIRFNDSLDNTIDNFSEAYSNVLFGNFKKFCNANNIAISTAQEILKTGTGLARADAGKYVFSPPAQILLNRYITWLCNTEDIYEDTPKVGVSLGEFGSLNGYAVFNYRTNTDFDWGSCVPLGSLADKTLSNGATYTILAPWGSSSCKISKPGNYAYRVYLTDAGLSTGEPYTLYEDYTAGKEVRKIYGSPCFFIKNSNGYKVYKGMIQHVYHTSYSTGEVDNDQYYLRPGSLYQEYEQEIPTLDITFDYDGSDLPNSTVQPTEDKNITINVSNYNEYNSNTYKEINNNPHNITIINNSGGGSGSGGEGSGGEGSGGEGGDTTNVNIDFPNFDFNIPDINFSLSGLTEKFPFCIPFDMVALLQLLNAEPQAPHIQGQIPFGSVYTWNLDLDFSRFDDFALIMRGLEFVGFIFFLITATLNIARG